MQFLIGLGNDTTMKITLANDLDWRILSDISKADTKSAKEKVAFNAIKKRYKGDLGTMYPLGFVN